LKNDAQQQDNQIWKAMGLLILVYEKLLQDPEAKVQTATTFNWHTWHNAAATTPKFLHHHSHNRW
jgi:hypothetical protein